MDKEYIQLPALQADAPWNVLNVTWEIDKLKQEIQLITLLASSAFVYTKRHFACWKVS